MPKDKATDAEAAEVRAMNDVLECFAPVIETLRGDLRDAMMDQLRNATSFSTIPEDKQKDILAAIDYAATELTRRAVVLLASDGQQQVQAKLEQITVKDGLKIVCTGVHTHDNLVLLGDAQGKQVLITLADAAKADGQRGPGYVDKDQPDMLDGGHPDDDSDLADAADPPQTQAEEEETEA